MLSDELLQSIQELLQVHRYWNDLIIQRLIIYDIRRLNRRIDNHHCNSFVSLQIEDDISSLDGYIMVLENGINQSDLENANGLLDDIISNIESSDLSVKVSYDFSIAKAKFELAKIYLSIGDLNSTYYRLDIKETRNREFTLF